MNGKGLDNKIMLASVGVFVGRKNKFIDSCNSDNTDGKKDCNKDYRNTLIGIIVIVVVTILLSVYFAIVVDSYAKRRENKERNAENSG
ncbi:17151_t:CDS:2 [Acaulospora morrowiae]|uniref:17151_t:CDS:1 n=1 Tax=Acaulospora morrowiae TaxID=94023 RepID=A0A9N8V0T8_9GLOM|nr:17151_t:CDS:2 [Acaulospora morrowiae]